MTESRPAATAGETEHRPYRTSVPSNEGDPRSAAEGTTVLEDHRSRERAGPVGLHPGEVDDHRRGRIGDLRLSARVGEKTTRARSTYRWNCCRYGCPA